MQDKFSGIILLTREFDTIYLARFVDLILHMSTFLLSEKNEKHVLYVK